MSFAKFCAAIASRSELESLLIEQADEADNLRAENEVLRAAAEPFVRIMRESAGRIPTERLSLADWHALAKAVTPNSEANARLCRQGDAHEA